MRNVVDIMLGKKLWRDDPGAVWENLIYPLAMPDSLCTLSTSQNSQAFALVRFSVTRDANEEIGLGEGRLGLFELPHVAMLRLVIMPKPRSTKLTQDEKGQRLHQHTP